MPTIDLSTAQSIGSGNVRRAFRHPEDPRFLLKLEERPIAFEPKWPGHRVTILPSNQREIEGYADIVRRLGGAPPYLCEVRGYVDTSQGPALMVEDAFYGANRWTAMNGFFKSGEGCFSRDEVLAARDQYAGIAAEFQREGIYNHCLRPESFALVDFGEGASLRFFDCKTLIYWQYIHPRFVPGGRRHIQGQLIAKMLGKFDKLLAKL